MAQSAVSRSPLRGYQWKDLFLPDTTSLRMTYHEVPYFAKVVDNDIIYRNHPVTPRGMTVAIAGDGRNAWRDLWVNCPKSATGSTLPACVPVSKAPRPATAIASTSYQRSCQSHEQHTERGHAAD
jgi:hypothetical protein